MEFSYVKGLFMDGIIFDIKEQPRLYQVNDAPINADLEKYIFKGQRCAMDERLSMAFRESAEKKCRIERAVSEILNIIGILVLVCVGIPIIGLILTASGNSDGSAASLIVPIILTICFALLGASALKISSDMKKSCGKYTDAINAVTPYSLECFRYGGHGILRYEYGSGDSSGCRYYIDLGDFYVEFTGFSDKWVRAEYVYAVIININGRDLFFMFNDLE